MMETRISLRALTKANTSLFWSVFLVLLAATAFAQNQARVEVRPITTPPSQKVVLVVDGKLIAAESVQLAPRTQQVVVGLRDLERIGWGIIELADQNRVVFKSKNVTLTFIKGQSTAMLNSLAVELPMDVYVKDGKLMVPLGFVAKALGYSYDATPTVIATINTTPQTALTQSTNRVQGTVTYNGRGVKGITVRLVDESFWAVQGAIDVTDESGFFDIGGLPDGTYKAHVWVQDNPAYFNRASEAVNVKDGQVASLKPIALGKILTPLRPKPEVSVRNSNGTIEFTWSLCEDAAEYKLLIRKRGSEEIVTQATSQEPGVRLPTNKLQTGVTYEAEVTATNISGEYLGGTAGVGGKPWTFTLSQ